MHMYKNKQKLAKKCIDWPNEQTARLTTLQKIVSEFSLFDSTCTALSPSKGHKSYYSIFLVTCLEVV